MRKRRWCRALEAISVCIPSVPLQYALIGHTEHYVLQHNIAGPTCPAPHVPARQRLSLFFVFLCALTVRFVSTTATLLFMGGRCKQAQQKHNLRGNVEMGWHFGSEGL